MKETFYYIEPNDGQLILTDTSYIEPNDGHEGNILLYRAK